MDENLDIHRFEANLQPLDTPDDEKIIIKAIGVGGGGNNAINHMYRQGIKNVSFVVCNTDRQALRHSPVPTQVQIGSGMGAGNKPEVARKAAEDDIDKIRALFDDDTKMVFITAGMGGGTGTGASPVVARVAKELGLLTIGIVTIPFFFEGDKKIAKALDGADEIAKYVDALLVINNERLTEIYGDLDFINAFGKADDTLSTAARSISEIITCEGHINLDFNDVDTTLRDGGAAIISTGYGEGDNRVRTAIDNALDSPLLRNRDIFKSKKLLFNLYFSRKAERPFVMSEVHELSDFVSNIDGVDVIWGVAFDDTLGDQVKITILAAGFDVTIREEEDDLRRDHGAPITIGSRPQRQQAAASSAKGRNDQTSRFVQEYGSKAMERRTNYIILAPNQLDNDAIIEILEKSPAYNREKKVLDEIKNTVKPQARPAACEPANSSVIDFSKDF
ncbi:MAG: cell division protein FtsZ [Bacteroidales bacterium]|nr:cell division protein FtsZ [Bacteroidales bacterium]